jgi:hypothetical protein
MSICTVEERRAGRSYPRTCPTCRLGPCQRGHWKGTRPPAQTASPALSEALAVPEVREQLEAARALASRLQAQNDMLRDQLAAAQADAAAARRVIRDMRGDDRG